MIEIGQTTKKLNMDEKQQEKPPKLTGRKLLAFELKFDNVTYKEIAQKTGYSESTIGKYFERGGKWRDHYDDWEKARVDEIVEAGRRRIQKRVAEALTVQETMLTMVSRNPKEAARAARDLLDRAGLKAPEKIEVTDPEDHAERITEWFENKNKQPNKNE